MLNNDYIIAFAMLEYNTLLTCFEASKKTNLTFNELLVIFADKIKEDASNKELLANFIKEYKSAQEGKA